MKPEGEPWRKLYEYDTPVIHVSGASQGDEVVELSGKATKLMHRFTKDQVHLTMDKVEEHSP